MVLGCVVIKLLLFEKSKNRVSIAKVIIIRGIDFISPSYNKTTGIKVIYFHDTLQSTLKLTDLLSFRFLKDLRKQLDQYVHSVFYSEKLNEPIFAKMAQKLAFRSTKRSPCSDFKFLVQDIAV